MSSSRWGDDFLSGFECWYVLIECLKLAYFEATKWQKHIQKPHILMVAVLWEQASAKCKQYLRNTSRWSADVMRPDPSMRETTRSFWKFDTLFSLFRCFPVLIRSWICPGLRDSPWFPLGHCSNCRNCRKAPNIEPVWLRIKRVWRASQGSEMTSDQMTSESSSIAAPDVAWFALLFLPALSGKST
jgi:hypothetical protein